jgi:hypothetical protein
MFCLSFTNVLMHNGAVCVVGRGLFWLKREATCTATPDIRKGAQAHIIAMYHLIGILFENEWLVRSGYLPLSIFILIR